MDIFVKLTKKMIKKGKPSAFSSPQVSSGTYVVRRRSPYISQNLKFADCHDWSMLAARVNNTKMQKQGATRIYIISWLHD